MLLPFLIVFVLLTGGTALLLSALATGKFGQAFVKEALERSLGQDVRVGGAFKLDLGSDARITLTDFTVENPQWPTNTELMRVRRGAVVIRLWPLLTGRLIVRRLELQGAKFAFETAADGRSNWTFEDETRNAPERRGAMARRLPILESVSVSETVISYHNRQNGWDFQAQLADLATKRSADGQQMTVDGRGLLNGKPLTIAGSVALRADEAFAVLPRKFQVALTGPALDARLEGRPGASNGEGLDVTLTGQSSSLGQFLELFQVERALEGKGSFHAQFVEDGGRLSIARFKADAMIEPGHVVSVSGAVADVLEGSGLDIDFTGKLAQKEADASRPAALHDIRLLAVSGKLGGTVDAVLLKEFTLSTNAIQRELREIGTLSVQTLRRDAKGRIGTSGIKALSGSPENPALEVTGSIGDILRLREIALAGRFRFATTSALGLGAGAAAAGLGRLQGEFSLSDKEGSLTIDKLSAKVTGTQLLALSLSSVDEASRQPDELSFDVSLQVPRFKQFAEAVGAPARDIGALSFKGRIGAGDQRLRAKGKATLGKTSISGDFLGDFSGERAILTGKLSSPLLHLSDAPGLLSATARPGSRPPPRDAAEHAAAAADRGSFTAKLLNGFDADVEIAVKKIAGAEDSAGNLAGRVKLNKGIVTLKGLRALYLGGRIRADGTIDARAQPPRLKLKASVDHWPVGAVLQKLGSKVPATGDLYLKMDLAAVGDTREAISSTISGSFEAALAGGRIRSSQLALTGLDLTSWLISAPTVKGYSDVRCLIARFAVKQGIATTKALVLDTPDVLLSGKGTIDLRRQTVKINVVPQPKQRKLVEVVTPFSITGPLASPKVTVSPAGAVARGTSEVVLLPANLLGTLVGLFSTAGADTGNPCLGR